MLVCISNECKKKFIERFIVFKSSCLSCSVNFMLDYIRYIALICGSVDLSSELQVVPRLRPSDKRSASLYVQDEADNSRSVQVQGWAGLCSYAFLPSDLQQAHFDLR